MILLNTSFFFAPDVEDGGKEWLEYEYLPALTCVSATAPEMFKVVDPYADDVVTFAIHAYFNTEDDVYKWLDSAPEAPYGEASLSMPSLLDRLI